MRHDHPAAGEQPTLFDAPPVLVAPPPGDTLQATFEAFHEANPWIAEALRRLARQLVDQGHRRIGMAMLFEVLRWNVALSTDDPASGFKLNHNYRSRYARLLMAEDPLLDGVFELRELTTA